METILIADDNQGNLKLLSEILIRSGYKVVSAKDGMEAINKLDENSVDLILLDIIMPKLNGFEVCQKIRELKKYDNTQIIFMTTLNKTEDVIQGLKLGACVYITKPYDKNELLARVRTHLEIKRNRVIILEQQKVLHEMEKVQMMVKTSAILLHETSDPLGIMIGNLQLLEYQMDQEKDPRILKKLKIAMENSEHIIALLKKIGELTPAELLEFDLKKDQLLKKSD